MALVQALVDPELSEPYSIFTYRRGPALPHDVVYGGPLRRLLPFPGALRSSCKEVQLRRCPRRLVCSTASYASSQASGDSFTGTVCRSH